MTITTDDNLGFYTPTHATQAEEDSAIAMIRDGAWVPVASGYGDADGFVSPAFLEVCEDAANQPGPRCSLALPPPGASIGSFDRSSEDRAPGWGS